MEMAGPAPHLRFSTQVEGWSADGGGSLDDVVGPQTFLIFIPQGSIFEYQAPIEICKITTVLDRQDLIVL